MNSVYIKNFTASAMLIFLSFLFLGASFALLGRNFLLEKEADDLAVCAQEIVHSAETFGTENLADWDLRMNLTSMAKITGNQIFLTDEAGWVVSCSDMELSCHHIGLQVPAEPLNSIASTGQYSQLTTLGGFFSSSHYVLAQPISSTDGNTLGYAFVASASRQIIDTWRTFITILLVVAVGILFLAIGISLYASKRQSRPLLEMADAAHRFARGDFSVRVKSNGGGDEIRELTRSFNAMADAIEQSEDMRRNFIANVSHELKTPMTTIAGFADGILDGTIPAEQQSRYLATISTETKRLNRLVRQMLDMSQLQRQDLEVLKSHSFDICDVLASTLLNFEKKINDKGLQVELQLPEVAMWVLGDKDAITQVVYNLLDNAVKFSPPGAPLRLWLWRQGERAYVSVKNQGETIPAEELPLIFDRFHKTDRSRSRDRDGVGLGLYIVKTILDNHNQDISVTSLNGETEFLFTLDLRPTKVDKPKSGKLPDRDGKVTPAEGNASQSKGGH